MAARDLFHQAVKNALIKEQWNVTDDPLVIQFGGVDLRIDLGAERLVAAEKDGERIAVEIKSFLGPSVISDFHGALGQFLNYRLALEAQESDRQLYLAIPEETFQTFFHLPFVQLAVQRYQLMLIVYNVVREELIQWIP
ncbi:XisH family protein [Candidatus Chloroploca sp. M-50]|uniref:Fatty-acid oxidation protein subunit alpha n=2 Tax=Candidatus Chloroploca TaxID=1579476 RepID=A0A2H3L127_9CHLR|nr:MULTISPECIES: XisH family protein [Candidatus Chloroploca]MBP1468621.1 XisH family protein [Candidatus Chloroploca mongolica]PDV96847.1 fatty-acid oxidation protein subunit alpha [Candidatus Chloroploca asiatica]